MGATGTLGLGVAAGRLLAVGPGHGQPGGAEHRHDRQAGSGHHQLATGTQPPRTTPYEFEFRLLGDPPHVVAQAVEVGTGHILAVTGFRAVEAQVERIVVRHG